MRISVVMTTYNGQKFIIDQLNSIKNQSRVPDEVIIIDDLSTDNTCDLIKEYITKNKLRNWKLSVNKVNLGWKKNFINAMQLASGDIIFLSDQDDIWMTDKIECMSEIMEKDSNIELLVGNSKNFYSSEGKRSRKFYSIKNKAFYLDGIWNGNTLLSRINSVLKTDKKNTNKLKKIHFDESVFSNQRQGCVMSVTKNLINTVVNYWNEACPHDTLLWFYACANDKLFFLERYVINYRHHEDNTGFKDIVGLEGLSARSEINKIKKNQEQINDLLFMLYDINIEELDKKKEIIHNIIKYNSLRLKFLKEKRLLDGIKVLKGRKYVGNRQVLFDWLLAYLT